MCSLGTHSSLLWPFLTIILFQVIWGKCSFTLKWRKKTRWALRDFRQFVLYGSQNGFTVSADVKLCRVSRESPCTEGRRAAKKKDSSENKNQTVKTIKWAGYAVQICVDPSADPRPDVDGERPPGPALDHFDGQPVSALGPVPRTVLLLRVLLILTVSLHRERPVQFNKCLTTARVECCGHGGEPLIDEAIVPHTMMYEVRAVI